MRAILPLLLTVALLGSAPPKAFADEPGEVRLINKSQPTRCAEVDNVDFRLVGADTTSFHIELTYPSYLTPETEDLTEPVWTDCDFGGGVGGVGGVHKAEPERMTLYEDDRWLLLGQRYASFWRPADVPVLVGDDRFDGLHLIQLAQKGPEGQQVQVLVLYPPDGYWRAKPLPPAGRDDTVFGSSFLVGPVEDRLRPIVALADVRFEPDTLAFELRFAGGGEGRVAIVELDDAAMVLDVQLDGRGDVAPFAALRSMFVDPVMADATVVRLERDGRDARTQNIMNVDEATVGAVAFLRDQPSHHNTSAPDVRFHSFQPLVEGGDLLR